MRSLEWSTFSNNTGLTGCLPPQWKTKVRLACDVAVARFCRGGGGVHR